MSHDRWWKFDSALGEESVGIDRQRGCADREIDVNDR